MTAGAHTGESARAAVPVSAPGGAAARSRMRTPLLTSRPGLATGRPARREGLSANEREYAAMDETPLRAISDAWRQDAGFRAAVEEDAKAALASKGLNIPGPAEVSVAVDTEDVTHFCVPAGSERGSVRHHARPRLGRDLRLARCHGSALRSGTGSVGSAARCPEPASRIGIDAGGRRWGDARRRAVASERVKKSKTLLTLRHSRERVCEEILRLSQISAGTPKSRRRKRQ